MTQLNLIVQPLRQGVSASGAFSVHVLLRVQAPLRPADLDKTRAPLHLAVVLDRSGSMSGTPLREACRCASAIAERLVAGDRLAVIAYDNRIRVIRPCEPVTDLAALQHQIQSIDSGGSTDLHGGWAAGVKALKKVHRPDVISRVLLLSDGAANEGVTEPEALAVATQAAAKAGMSTSTYGLGRGFEEGVMTAMAKSGAGRSYYGDLAEDLLDPFMEEFDLLSNLVGRKLTLSYDLPAGCTVTQMNGFAVPEPGHWSLPDLAYQSEAWALFKIQGTISKQPGEELDLGRFELNWQDSQGKAMEALTATFSLPILSEQEALALPKDPMVASRLSELRIGELQELAHLAAEANDWDLVRVYLDEMKTLAADHPWSKTVVDELSALMENREYGSLKKEFLYQAMCTTDRLTDVNEESMGPSANSYTRRKPRRGKQMPPEPEPPKEEE